ncbi:hypothetical protein CTAYLR_007022 [Chrysophaeum taylorii]|uniref:BHLH domain-containing protein n=1 Tax=Chrysophaeum taylorii TaxID=2483200 RepID=A0AAD7XFI6_9STRA|nr:hypothetical protein CTAYLR_007022 [Chrysophaeum taylorii]
MAHESDESPVTTSELRFNAMEVEQKPPEKRRGRAQTKEKKRPAWREALEEAADHHGDDELEPPSSFVFSRPSALNGGPTAVSQRKLNGQVINGGGGGGSASQLNGKGHLNGPARHYNNNHHEHPGEDEEVRLNGRKKRDSATPLRRVVATPPTTPNEDVAKGSAPPQRANELFEARRLERNAREQRRSIKIVTQIDELAGILDEAGAPATKACKASILAGVSNYIEQLRSRNSSLESEQCDIVSKIISIAAGANPAFVNDEKHEEVDYRLVFLQSSIPMAVTSLDGKLLACNERFVAGIGAETQTEVLKRTLFDLAKPDRLQNVFSCIGDLLRSSESAPCANVPDAFQFTTSTLSITYIRPSSFAISLVEPVPTDVERPPPSLPKPILADVKRDLAVVEAARRAAPVTLVLNPDHNTDAIADPFRLAQRLPVTTLLQPATAIAVHHHHQSDPSPPQQQQQQHAPTGLEHRIIG